MRKTRAVRVGNIVIGGNAPVIMQSMCSTRTEDVSATVAQILALEKEGCDAVRVAVPNFESAENISKIKSRIKIPLIADIHFDYRLALAAIENGADKIRINPGNIGVTLRQAQGDNNVRLCQAEPVEALSKHHDDVELRIRERIVPILTAAKRKNVAIRLGVNSGSLEERLWKKYGRPSPEALVESALDWIKIFEKYDFTNFVISLKSSDVPETVRAYRLLAPQCDYPFHLGITEAGLPPYGAIKSAIGIGALLLDGIGDTIRASLSADPVEEIKVCKQILKSLHLYTKEPEVIACPTCGRIEIDLIKAVKEIEERLMKLGKPIKVSVMGCVVNGPGEAREADWGIAGGRKQGAIFRRGKVIKWVPEAQLVDEFMKLIEAEYSLSS